MDAKGITWIGNIYQKFEAMCLEVEEIMYQDTVKFVEDQVENVGTTVQKFYSEVMQDLDPPSSLDPGEVTAPEITMDKWDVGKTYKRPPTCIKRVSAKTGPNRFPKGSDVLGVVKKDGGHASSVKRLNIRRKPLSNPTRDSLLTEKEGKTELRFVTAAETQPPCEASGVVVPPSERTEIHSLQELSRNRRTIKHQDTTVSSAYVEMASGCSTTASIDENGLQNGFIDDSSPNIPSTNINIVDECIKNDGRKTEISSSLVDSDGTSFSNAVMPVAASSDVTEASYFKIPVNTDGADIGHNRCNSLIEHNLITLDNPDWGNLEESCIFINVDGHHWIPRSRGKQRSYKKTICDAFSSKKKKKTSRAREYEQLAVLYDDTVSPKDCSAESGKGRTSEAHGSSECDWELL